MAFVECKVCSIDRNVVRVDEREFGIEKSDVCRIGILFGCIGFGII